MDNGHGLSSSLDTRSETPLFELSPSKLALRLVQDRIGQANAGDSAVELVKERQAIIRARADRAETRAAITLGAVGVLVGLVVGTVGFAGEQQDGWRLIGGTLAASLILLLKSAHFSLRALDALQGNELSPEAALDMAQMSDDDAARFELAARTWECFQALPITNARLYYAQRGQKNLAFAAGMWCIAGGLIFLSAQGFLDLAGWIEIVGATLAGVVALFLDRLIEKWKGFWQQK